MNVTMLCVVTNLHDRWCYITLIDLNMGTQRAIVSLSTMPISIYYTPDGVTLPWWLLELSQREH